MVNIYLQKIGVSQWNVPCSYEHCENVCDKKTSVYQLDTLFKAILIVHVDTHVQIQKNKLCVMAHLRCSECIPPWLPVLYEADELFTAPTYTIIH